MIIWPTDLDSSKSRARGRRIPKGQGIGQPKLTELQQAAQILGLTVEPVASKSKPSSWWERTGYLIVARKGKSRTVILKELAREIQRVRREEAAKEKSKPTTRHA